MFSSVFELDDGFNKSDFWRISCDIKVIVFFVFSSEFEGRIYWNLAEENEDFFDKCLICLFGCRIISDWLVIGVKGSEVEIRRWLNNDVILLEIERFFISIFCD